MSTQTDWLSPLKSEKCTSDKVTLFYRLKVKCRFWPDFSEKTRGHTCPSDAILDIDIRHSHNSADNTTGLREYSVDGRVSKETQPNEIKILLNLIKKDKILKILQSGRIIIIITIFILSAVTHSNRMWRRHDL